MVRPRDDHHEEHGVFSIAEQRVYDKLNKIGQNHEFESNFQIDSIMESAFDTERN